MKISSPPGVKKEDVVLKSLTTTLGDIIYASAANTPERLGGNTTVDKKYLQQVGTGSVSAAPSWKFVPGQELGRHDVSTEQSLTGTTTLSDLTTVQTFTLTVGSTVTVIIEARCNAFITSSSPWGQRIAIDVDGTDYTSPYSTSTGAYHQRTIFHSTSLSLSSGSYVIKLQFGIENAGITGYFGNRSLRAIVSS